MVSQYASAYFREDGVIHISSLTTVLDSDMSIRLFTPCCISWPQSEFKFVDLRMR